MTTQVITLELPLDLYHKLKFLATEQKKDPTTIIGQLITRAYEQQPRSLTPAFQTILENAMDLGITDLAARHDYYLCGDAEARHHSSPYY